jgi:hypothetical protein
MSIGWLFFFTIKTHKIDWPLRPIISERGTWVQILSGFIKGFLGWINLKDPFKLKNSEQMIMTMSNIHGKEFCVKSHDVSDMYFAIDQVILIKLIKKKIEEQGTIEFQNKFKISPDQAVRLVEIYLKSTIIKDGKFHYRQTNGVPIGSQAAPVICDIYMESFDLKLYEKLKSYIDEGRIFIDRFVDDFKSLYESEELEIVVDQAFQETGDSLRLKLTEEKVNEDEEIQFLDTRINVKQGLCFRYQQRSEKPLLSYESHHEKYILKGIAMNVLRNACEKSCSCMTQEAIKLQERRLRKGKYPEEFILAAKRRIVNPSQRQKSDWEQTKVATIPRIHKVTHQIMKDAGEFGVKVIPNYRNKFETLPGRIDRLRESKSSNKDIECVKHEVQAFPCIKNSIYNVVLTCKAEYVGETLRCPNIRLKEHTTGATKSSVKDHIGTCRCKVDIENSCILSSKPIKGTHSRKIAETLYMEQKYNEIGEDRLISRASVIPTISERTFISKYNLIPSFNK